MKIIIDFVKSWLYHPTLRKCFNTNNYNEFKDSRFRYAIKYCRMRKTIRDNKNNPLYWTSTYQQEPIIK